MVAPHVNDLLAGDKVGRERLLNIVVGLARQSTRRDDVHEIGVEVLQATLAEKSSIVLKGVFDYRM